MSPLERRAKAAQATLERYKDKPFKFGHTDCWQMVRYHLRLAGKPVKACRGGTYHSLLGAKKVLKAEGAKTVMDLMDAKFWRIAPAATIVGDIIEMPGEEGLGALAIAMGNGRALAYHEDAIGAVIVQPHIMTAAWRIM